MTIVYVLSATHRFATNTVSTAHVAKSEFLICFFHEFIHSFEMGSLHLSTVCWSRWFDLDNPSGTGDWETLSSLRKKYPGAICDEPLLIEAVTVDTRTPALATGQNFYM